MFAVGYGTGYNSPHHPIRLFIISVDFHVPALQQAQAYPEFYNGGSSRAEGGPGGLGDRKSPSGVQSLIQWQSPGKGSWYEVPQKQKQNV